MNNREQEICDKIIQRYLSVRSGNKYVLEITQGLRDSRRDLSEEQIKATIEELSDKEYKLTDYVDKRRCLIHIPNYCEDTGEKVDRSVIKKALLEYEKSL